MITLLRTYLQLTRLPNGIVLLLLCIPVISPSWEGPQQTLETEYLGWNRSLQYPPFHHLPPHPATTITQCHHRNKLFTIKKNNILYVLSCWQHKKSYVHALYFNQYHEVHLHKDIYKYKPYTACVHVSIFAAVCWIHVQAPLALKQKH